MSKISQLIDKLITCENKDKLKKNVITPILNEMTNEVKPYFFFLVGIYISIVVPLLIIIIILLTQKKNL